MKQVSKLFLKSLLLSVLLLLLINAKLQIGNRGQKTGLTEKSSLRRRKSALDCSAIYEDYYYYYYYHYFKQFRICGLTMNP